jgi:hypothetical protein
LTPVAAILYKDAARINSGIPETLSTRINRTMTGQTSGEKGFTK